MTEDKAKTTWCPKVQLIEMSQASGGGIVTNRGDYTLNDPTQYTRCIGSACMWWRFSESVIGNDNCHGYCGGAGKP